MEKKALLEYLAVLKEKQKKNRVYYPHQSFGLLIAETLNDEIHKSLYIKMAKEHDGRILLELAKDIASRKKVESKAAYFMKLVKIFKDEGKLPKSPAKKQSPAKNKKKKTKNKAKTMRIFTTDNPKDEKFLRAPVAEMIYQKKDAKDIRRLVKDMREAMKKASGIGLSANQVGVSRRVFIARLPDKENKSKFYIAINPKILKQSEENAFMEEGCLSIPLTFGDVERPVSITIESESIVGKKIKINGRGLLARVFQHELDHLNGILFTDKAKNIRKESPGGENEVL